MRETTVIRQSGANSDNADKESHAEAVEFVNRHRRILEHEARGAVSIRPAPPGLGTFAFNLKTDEIYVNSMFYKNRGLSDAKTTFATRHEIRHFKKKKQLLAEPGGDIVFDQYLKRIELSKAWGHMDNCIDDIAINRGIVADTHEASGDLEKTMYREDLFPDMDFTAQPKHIQFSQALLRESRVPDEKCTVAPEVRAKIDELRGYEEGDINLFTTMTDPDVPMSTRLKLQEKFVWPIVKELLEKDMEDNTQKQQGQGAQQGQPQSGQAGQPQESSEGQGKKEKKGWFGRKKKSEPQAQAPQQAPQPPQQPSEPQETDPNKIFADAYKRAEEKALNAVPIESQKEALEEWRNANDPDRADQRKADAIGVEKKDLLRYRDLAAQVRQIRDPEKTGELVVEELRQLIERIIANRTKQGLKDQYDLEEGSEFDAGELVVKVKSGNFNPDAWVEPQFQEVKGKRHGRVHWYSVGDPSTSMRGIKQKEHLKMEVLEMETFTDLNKLADDEKSNLDTPLEIHTAFYAFASSPIKPLGKELTEKQRIEVATAFSTVYGSTPMYLPLEAINADITPEVERRIRDGELKVIVKVGTDGESDDTPRTQRAIKALLDKKVVVVIVCITESAAKEVETFAPNSVLAPRAEDLPGVLAGILKEHLADV